MQYCYFILAILLFYFDNTVILYWHICMGLRACKHFLGEYFWMVFQSWKESVKLATYDWRFMYRGWFGFWQGLQSIGAFKEFYFLFSTHATLYFSCRKTLSDFMTWVPIQFMLRVWNINLFIYKFCYVEKTLFWICRDCSCQFFIEFLIVW